MICAWAAAAINRQSVTAMASLVLLMMIVFVIMAAKLRKFRQASKKRGLLFLQSVRKFTNLTKRRWKMEREGAERLVRSDGKPRLWRRTEDYRRNRNNREIEGIGIIEKSE
jgi:hypothetical protein